VTRKASTPAKRKGTVSISFENPGIKTSFGPLDATGLYAEDADTKRVPVAHARSFWGEVAKAAVRWAGDKAVEIGRDAFRGYPRVAYARTGGPYGGIDVDEITYTGSLTDFAVLKPAKQSWLQRITNKIGRYVYGAAVTEGPDTGVYIDEVLAKRAGRYVKEFYGGFREAAKEYAGDFIEALKTSYHEYAHLAKGIIDETLAEKYADGRVYELAAADSAVGFALNQYKTRGGRFDPLWR